MFKDMHVEMACQGQNDFLHIIILVFIQKLPENQALRINTTKSYHKQGHQNSNAIPREIN